MSTNFYCNVPACAVVASLAFSSILARAADDGPVEEGAPRVTLVLLALASPTVVQTTDNLDSLGSRITRLDEITPGENFYLEAWCQTPGPNGLSSAVFDLTYDTQWLDSSLGQVSLAPQWNVLAFSVTVNDALGQVDNLGGNNFAGLGVAPNWAKIGTVGFSAEQVPDEPLLFCSSFAGGGLLFAIRSEGGVAPADVDYQCTTIGCPQSVAGFYGLFFDFSECLDGPDLSVLGCDCEDWDRDGDIDLQDFSELQRTAVAP